MKLTIKVVPGSSQTAIAGWLGNLLKIKVVAPPEKGKANAEVEALLASVLNIPPAQVSIVAGHRSPRKSVEISGMSDGEIKDTLTRLGLVDR